MHQQARDDQRPTGKPRKLADLLDAPTVYNLDAAKFSIGAMLRDSTVAQDIIAFILDGEVFLSTNERAIFEVCSDLDRDGVTIDLLSVNDRLTQKGYPLAIGGPREALALLQHDCVTWHNWKPSAEILLRDHALNKARAILTEALDAVIHPSGPLDDVMGFLEKELAAITTGSTAPTAVPIVNVFTEALAEISRRRESKGAGIRYGFTALDEMTGGLWRQELVILAARPGTGKTALALNIADHVATSGPALFVSLEMSRGQLAERMLADASGIDGSRLRNGHIDERDVSALAQSAGSLEGSRLLIADPPAATMPQIVSIARRAAMRQPLSLIVVDYLGLISAERSQARENTNERIASYSKGLKRLARELDCPVLCLAQLNRQVEGRNGGVPRLADLRDSGAIEQDADAVLLIHRPEMYGDNERRGQADVIIAKQRNGPLDTIRLRFRRELTRFEDMEQAFTPMGDDGPEDGF